MPQSQLLVGQVNLSDGATPTARAGRQGETMTSNLHGMYYEQAVRRNTHVAHAIVTAPVIYTTAAGTGGPLLWNPPSTGVNAVILAVGFGVTTVTTVAAALGLTGNSGQTSAPGSTTAIDSRTNLYIGGAQAACSVYRVGTPTNAGGFFIPFGALHTGALTVDNTSTAWINIDGMLIVPPGCWASIAASATATTTVAQLAMVWEEVPV